MKTETLDHMTIRKANTLLLSKRRQITGLVLCDEDGKRIVIDMGAVRHLDKDAFWALMHPAPSPAPMPESLPPAHAIMKPESKDELRERIRQLEAEIERYKGIADCYRGALGDVKANTILAPFFHAENAREERRRYERENPFDWAEAQRQWRTRQ